MARSEGRDWTKLSRTRLLGVRFCDLGLRIEGTRLEARIDQLYRELASRGLTFRPPCWLADEWFSPDGGTGIAIPFYLAHPRLMRLEERMMLEVEGGTKTWCMQLLRHEAGHVYETAYRLSRRKRWRELFGRASRPYPEYYNPQPFSRDYVHHLDWWYAQSHPCEDFAETFAVWLRTKEKWRRRYRDWPALEKLEYVDELMRDIAGRRPLLRSDAPVDPLDALATTLGEHYREKQRRYGRDHPDFYDRDLRRLFADAPGRPGLPKAAVFLRRIAPEIRRVVAAWTGEYVYTVNMPLKEMIARCRELDLRLARPADEVKLEAAVLLTMQTTNWLHSTEHRLAM